MNQWFEQLDILFDGNLLWFWTVRGAIAAVITFTIKLCLRIVATRLRKVTDRTRSVWDDVGIDIIDSLRMWVLFVWVIFLLTNPMNVPEPVRNGLLIVVVTVSIFQVGFWGWHLLGTWRRTIIEPKIQQDPSSAAALGLLYTVVRIAFVVTIVLIGLSNVGVNISALLAGLGVGGIAIALAAQNVLGDLLASLSIVLDKPFVVGDFIISGSEMGTVEHIGIKTTRLRSLAGEQIVLSNKDILESRIQNYKRMWQRRVVRHFRVVYSTPADVLEQIPGWVKAIVERHEQLRFDRCHFSGYGTSSLDFELVFYVLNPDYNFYMDLQQKVLLDIFRKFHQESVEFAFPSQSIYVEKMPPMAAMQMP